MEGAILSSDDEFKFNVKRKKNWTNPYEMEAFLNLWEENCQELSQLKRNISIFYKISYKMKVLGFRRDPLELRKKLSNVIFKYKHEKTHHTDWPYFERVHQILNKMKHYQENGPNAAGRSEESNSETPRNKPQKIVLNESRTNEVCVNEADMNTILKAMNGEDITSIIDKASSVLEMSKTVIKSPDSHHSCCHDGESSSSNDATSETSMQKSKATKSPPQNLEMSDQCTPSTSAIKRKADDQQLQPKKEKRLSITEEPVQRNEIKRKASEQQLQPRIEKTFSITEEPMQKTEIKRKGTDQQLQPRIEKSFPITEKLVQKNDESKTCNCKKDEVDLYTELLATKLKSMDEKSRHIAMNRIDNILFRMKMDLLESQQRLHNYIVVTPKSLSSTPNTKE